MSKQEIRKLIEECNIAIMTLKGDEPTKTNYAIQVLAKHRDTLVTLFNATEE